MTAFSSTQLLDIDSAVLAGHRLAEHLCCAMTRNGWSNDSFPDHPQDLDMGRILSAELVGWLLQSNSNQSSVPLEYRIQALEVVINRLASKLDLVGNIDGINPHLMQPHRRVQAEELEFEINADFIVARSVEELAHLMELQSRAPALSTHADHINEQRPISNQRFKRG